MSHDHARWPESWLLLLLEILFLNARSPVTLYCSLTILKICRREGNQGFCSWFTLIIDYTYLPPSKWNINFCMVIWLFMLVCIIANANQFLVWHTCQNFSVYRYFFLFCMNTSRSSDAAVCISAKIYFRISIGQCN